MSVRERILEAALRVFEEAGTKGATTRRIAAAAGVNEVTLFRHFGTKGALLTEAVHRAAGREEGLALPDEPGDARAELTRWAAGHLAHLRRMRALIRTCMGEVEMSPELAGPAGRAPARVADELGGYVRRLQARGRADPAVHPDAAAGMLMGALFTDAMGRDVMAARYAAFSEAEAPALYVELFLRALGAAEGAGEDRGAEGAPRRTDHRTTQPGSP